MIWQIDSDGFAFSGGKEIFYTRVNLPALPYKYAVVEYDEDTGVDGIKILDFARGELEARVAIEGIVNKRTEDDD